MGERARVRSVSVLRELQPEIVKFVDACRVALVSADTDALRTLDWLRGTQMAHWKSEIRRRTDDLNSAKSELARKQMGKAEDAKSTVEERKRVERCKRLIDEAEQRLAATEHWSRRLDRAVQGYRGGSAGLRRTLDADMPRALAELERMSAALEAYVALRVDGSATDAARGAAAAAEDAARRVRGEGEGGAGGGGA